MFVEEKKRRSHLNYKCMIKEWLKLSFVTNGSRLEHARTEVTVSLLMALRNSVQSFAIPVTRLKCALWSLMANPAPMAIVATSAIPLLTRRNSWRISLRLYKVSNEAELHGTTNIKILLYCVSQAKTKEKGFNLLEHKNLFINSHYPCLWLKWHWSGEWVIWGPNLELIRLIYMLK